MSQQMRLTMSRRGVLVLARHTVISVSLCLVPSWGALTPLWAQTPPKRAPAEPSTEVPQALGPVVVTGRADDLVGIVGSASEGRVGQAQFETRPLLRPGEVLEIVPGVAVT